MPARKPFLLAHSMGAAIGLDYACDHQDELSGLVLSAARSPRSTRRRRFALAARAVARVSPGRGIFKVDPETVSRDPEVIRAYDEDPLNFHGSFPAESIVALRAGGDELPEAAAGAHAAAADPARRRRQADPAQRQPAGRRAGQPRTTRRSISIPALRHEILNEPEQDAIIDEIVAWLIARS